jgi:hypothetical protein
LRTVTDYLCGQSDESAEDDEVLAIEEQVNGMFRSSATDEAAGAAVEEAVLTFKNQLNQQNRGAGNYIQPSKLVHITGYS